MTELYGTLIQAGYIFFQLFYYLIFIRVIFSWVRPNPNNKFVIIINNLTDPILEPFRRLSHRLNIGGGMIDLSPLLAILAIQFLVHPLYEYIINLLFQFMR